MREILHLGSRDDGATRRLMTPNEGFTLLKRKGNLAKELG
jgi:hypothetical protein